MEARSRLLIAKLLSLIFLPLFYFIITGTMRRAVVFMMFIYPLYALVLFPRVVLDYYRIGFTGDYFFILALFLAYLYGLWFSLFVFIFAIVVSMDYQDVGKKEYLFKIAMTLLFLCSYSAISVMAAGAPMMIGFYLAASASLAAYLILYSIAAFLLGFRRHDIIIEPVSNIALFAILFLARDFSVFLFMH